MIISKFTSGDKKAEVSMSENHGYNVSLYVGDRIINKAYTTSLLTAENIADNFIHDINKVTNLLCEEFMVKNGE